MVHTLDINSEVEEARCPSAWGDEATRCEMYRSHVGPHWTDWTLSQAVEHGIMPSWVASRVLGKELLEMARKSVEELIAGGTTIGVEELKRRIRDE